jgi:cytochrome P450
MLSSKGEARRTAVHQMHDAVVDLVATKRTAPADDLLTAIVQAHDGTERLSQDELTSLAFVLLFAGYENTTHLIANSIATLLQRPDQLSLIRAESNPHTPAMQLAVEEFLRYDGPVLTALHRYPRADLTINDTTIPAGDLVLAALASANRDPDIFTEPDTLDLTRTDNPHLALGTGIHYCLGAAVARLETRVAIWKVCQRLSAIQLALPHARLPWKNDYRQRALADFPIRYGYPPEEQETYR